ncbi:MAG: hypothetical protein WDZ77_03205 [Candidatus Pacearchaeota archaeon]
MAKLNNKKLAGLLLEASRAHHKYEKKIGNKDSKWHEWYSKFILDKLENEQ